MVDKIKIALGALLPYQYLDNNNEIRGLNYEIIMKSFNLANYDVDVEICNTNEEVVKKLIEQKIDGTVLIEENTKVSELNNCSELLVNSKMILLKSKNDININSLEEAANKKLYIGYLKGYEFDSLTKNIQHDHIIRYSSYSNLSEGLDNNKIDIGIIDSRVKEYFSNGTINNNIIVIPNLSYNLNIYITFRAENINLKRDFNKGFKRLVDTNQYFEIVKHWELSNKNGVVQ